MHSFVKTNSLSLLLNYVLIIDEVVLVVQVSGQLGGSPVDSWKKVPEGDLVRGGIVKYS